MLPSFSTFFVDSQPPRHWNQKSVEQHVENTIKSCGMIRGAKRCGSGYTRTLRDLRSKWSPKWNQSKLQQIGLKPTSGLQRWTMGHAVLILSVDRLSSFMQHEATKIENIPPNSLQTKLLPNSCPTVKHEFLRKMTIGLKGWWESSNVGISRSE